jgi:NADPH-dependent 2,4-dienoyl-CoA reductase/sulfur reductase-like enzyme
VAGANIGEAGNEGGGAGERFAGVVGTSVLKVCDLEVARAGLSMREADAAGLDAVGTVLTHKSRASYYPGWQPIRVKLVAERGTGRFAWVSRPRGTGKRCPRRQESR